MYTFIFACLDTYIHVRHAYTTMSGYIHTYMDSHAWLIQTDRHSCFSAYIYSYINTHRHHVFLPTYKHIYIHSIHVCMHSNVHACIHMYIHTFIHTYRHTCIQIFMHVCIIYIHTYYIKYACIHAHNIYVCPIHIYIYIYIYIYILYI